MFDLNILFEQWSLIFFTTFAQFASGIAVFAGILSFMQEKDNGLLKKMYTTSFVLMVLGGIASMLHLSNPLNAFYTITQVAHSPLSREIATVGLFSALLIFQLIKPSKLVAFLVSISGLLMVLAISQAYVSVEAMPFWSNMGTYFAFYGTTLLLGGAYALWQGKSLENNNFEKIAYFSLFIGIVFSLSAKLNWIKIFLMEQNLQTLSGVSADMFNFTLYVMLIIVGLIMFLLNKTKNNNLVSCVALGCFLVAEILNRAFFFIAQFKIGV